MTFYRQIDGSWDNCTTVIQKPIIIIDGFDPKDERHIVRRKDGEKYIDGIWDLLAYDSKTKHLGDELRKKGFDVIILNFPEYPIGGNKSRDGGADYIERNAMVLVRLIQKVDSILKSVGSNEQIVVVGPSMGGQIARYALAYMEKEFAQGNSDMDHNTRLYVSFDSPHLGANIPLSLQYSIYHLGRNFNKQSARESYDEQLYSKAARQMLIEQIENTKGRTAFYMQYYGDLHRNGIPGSNGWPMNLKKVALINGSSKGYKVGSEATELLKITVGALKVMNVKALSIPTYGTLLKPHFKVKGAVTVGKNVPIYINSVSREFFNTNTHGSMDVVPGGTFHTAEVLKEEIEKGAGRLSTSTTKLERHSFIPSISALAFINSDFEWSTSFNHRHLVCEDAIPFDSYYAPSSNEKHIHLTPESTKWIMEEIEKGKADCLPICKKSAMVTNDFTALCVNNLRSFYHNYALPPGATTTWSIADNPDDISIFYSDSNKITIKGLQNNLSVKVKYTINNPCGVNIEGTFKFPVGLVSGVLNATLLYNNMNEINIENYFPNRYSYEWAWSDSYNWVPASGKKYPDDIPIKYTYDSSVPKLCLKTSNICTSEVECVYPYDPNGIINAQIEIEDKVIVYPNPGKDIWNVIFTNVGAVNDLKLYNAIGALVWESKTDEISTEINISHLSPGMYILKVKNKQWNQTIKLVKE